MGWQELLALTSIPSGLLALYSMYTAYERWRADEILKQLLEVAGGRDLGRFDPSE